MKAMGGRKKTEEFFRLFLIPGVHDCAGGPGLTDFDALTALELGKERSAASHPDRSAAGQWCPRTHPSHLSVSRRPAVLWQR